MLAPETLKGGGGAGALPVASLGEHARAHP